MSTPAPDWTTDAELFASLPGGQTVIDWFGFCPDFHDGSLERLELSVGNAMLVVRTFRMTSRTDQTGFFVLDRHAAVVLRMRGVTGLKLKGDAQSGISELVIRRLQTDGARSDWETCAGPVAGNIEIALGTSVGLYGSIFTQELEFELQPCLENAAP
jgi:hypothetical protein